MKLGRVETIQTPMNRKLLPLVVFTLLAFAQSNWAGGSHSHGHSHGKLPEVPQTVPGAWKTIQDNVAKIEKANEKKDFKTIHTAEPYVQAGIKVLQSKSTMVEAANQKRLQGALKQASKAGHNLHHAADHGSQKGVSKGLKQLQGALKLVAAQYPDGALE